MLTLNSEAIIYGLIQEFHLSSKETIPTKLLDF